MDYNKIREAAEGYKTDMTRFLRAIVKNPGESCGEKDHIDTIAAEMKKLNFDEVVIDPQGNVIGYMAVSYTHLDVYKRQRKYAVFRRMLCSDCKLRSGKEHTRIFLTYTSLHWEVLFL